MKASTSRIKLPFVLKRMVLPFGLNFRPAKGCRIVHHTSHSNWNRGGFVRCLVSRHHDDIVVQLINQFTDLSIRTVFLGAV